MEANNDEAIGWKITGVSVIQTVGVIFAMVLHYLNSKEYGTMEEDTFRFLFEILFLLLIGSVLVGLFSRPILEGIRKMGEAFLRRPIPVIVNRPNEMRLARILHIFALSDFIVVFNCIIHTGGSEHSVYAPFLFIIVPVLLIVRVFSAGKLFAYGLLSLTIYAFGLCQYIFPTDFTPKGEGSHAWLLIFSTAVCILFPITYSALELWLDSPAGRKN